MNSRLESLHHKISSAPAPGPSSHSSSSSQGGSRRGRDGVTNEKCDGGGDEGGEEDVVFGEQDARVANRSSQLPAHDPMNRLLQHRRFNRLGQMFRESNVNAAVDIALAAVPAERDRHEIGESLPQTRQQFVAGAVGKAEIRY